MWRSKLILFSIVVGLVVSMVISTGVKAYIKPYIETADVDLTALEIDPNPTYVYDGSEDLMTKQKKEKKYQTDLSEIPEIIQTAVIATEDGDFYKHAGVDAKSMFRAALINIKNGGEFKQGASTLTQQLVKNIYLTSEKEWERKIREITMALSLEQELTKDQILENYLNHVYYGQDAYGIKDAVRTFYGQSFDEFSQDDRIDQIAKAALLAGLVQRPSAYDPFSDPSLALNRRNEVLLSLLRSGHITEEEHGEAIKKSLLIAPQPQRVAKDEEIKYGEIVQYVFHEASGILDMTPEEVRYSGVKIYTSFDPQVYNIIRKHYDNPDNFHPNASDGATLESGTIFSNPQTGEIVAFTGGRTIPEYSRFNRAWSSDMERQPGSAFKPIAVYAPALNTGKYFPWSKLNNSPRNFGSGANPYVPKNWDGKYTGTTSMTEALRTSMNVPAVSTLQEIGMKKAVSYLESAGINMDNDDSGLSMALGGIRNGVSPLNMADAYQAFANGGYRIPLHMITRIVNAEGDIIYDADRTLSEENRILKKEAAEYMRFMLEDVVQKGTGRRAQVEGQMIAGKTGSTQSIFKDGGDSDGWFVGFNKNYVGAIWMGFDSSNAERYMTNASGMPAQLFGAIMKDLTKIKPDPASNYSKPVPAKPKTDSFSISGSYDAKQQGIVLKWNAKEETLFQVVKNNKPIGEPKDITTYIDKSGKPGETITYKVIGYDIYSDFKSYESKMITVKVPNEQKLATPSDFSFVQNGMSYQVSWKASAGATAYELLVNGESVYKGNNLSIELDGLDINTTYTLSLVALNEKQSSSPATLQIQTDDSLTSAESSSEEDSAEPTEPSETTETPASDE